MTARQRRLPAILPVDSWYNTLYCWLCRAAYARSQLAVRARACTLPRFNTRALRFLQTNRAIADACVTVTFVTPPLPFLYVLLRKRQVGSVPPSPKPAAAV